LWWNPDFFENFAPAFPEYQLRAHAHVRMSGFRAEAIALANEMKNCSLKGKSK
jgi:hypothetical protein